MVNNSHDPLDLPCVPSLVGLGIWYFVGSCAKYIVGRFDEQVTVRKQEPIDKAA